MLPLLIPKIYHNPVRSTSVSCSIKWQCNKFFSLYVFPPVTIISPMIHTHLLIYHRQHVISATDSAITYLLTPSSTVLLEKLTGSQLVKKFPAFYGTQKFIIEFKVPATYPYPKSDQSSQCPIPLPADPV